MDGMKKKERLGLPPPPPPPPLPPRSRAHPSTPACSFLKGFSHSNVVPHYHSQQYPQNHPLISGSEGSEVSFRTTDPVTVSADATRDPQPDPNSDDRRLRRLLSNRISAQKSRLRRINYINEMETQVKEFEAQISQLTPEMILTQRKKKLLEMDNELMKQKKLTLQERINLKNAETEAYRTELYHLRQLFELQQQQKQGWLAAWASDYITDQGMYQVQGGLQAQAHNMYDQLYRARQQEFENPNMRQSPSGSENLGISMTDRDQIAACEACNRPAGHEGMHG